MPKVTPITCALVTALVAAPGAAVGQQDSSPWLPPEARNLPNNQNQVSTVDDTTGIRMAVQGNFTEVALGRLADDRASDSEVKDFGKRMVSDHDAMNDQWSKLASKYHLRIMNPGPDYGTAGKDAIDRLEKLKGSEFDQAYMIEMIRDHEQDLSEFQRLRYSASDPEIRDLASSGASTIEQHLTLAREVGSRVGVATTAGRVGTTYPSQYPAPYPAPNSTGNATRTPTTTGAVANEANGHNDHNAPPLSNEDRAFVDRVLDDHLLHLRLARVVQRDARLDETKELAKRVEDELTHWAKRWNNFADRHNADVTVNLDQNDRAKIERIQQAKEKNVDHAYAQILSNHLKQMVDRFRHERWDERRDAAGVTAQKELPVLDDLLQRARTLERQTNNEKK
jgi:putative membrane protein